MSESWRRSASPQRAVMTETPGASPAPSGTQASATTDPAISARRPAPVGDATLAGARSCASPQVGLGQQLSRSHRCRFQGVAHDVHPVLDSSGGHAVWRRLHNEDRSLGGPLACESRRCSRDGGSSASAGAADGPIARRKLVTGAIPRSMRRHCTPATHDGETRKAIPRESRQPDYGDWGTSRRAE